MAKRSVLKPMFSPTAIASSVVPVLEQASLNRDVGVYFHEGFWQCMDTPRDLEHLENKFRNIS